MRRESPTSALLLLLWLSRPHLYKILNLHRSPQASSPLYSQQPPEGGTHLHCVEEEREASRATRPLPHVASEHLKWWCSWKTCVKNSVWCTAESLCCAPETITTLLVGYAWVSACKVASVMSDTLRSSGLQPARLLWPWESPGKNTVQTMVLPSYIGLCKIVHYLLWVLRFNVWLYSKGTSNS